MNDKITITMLVVFVGIHVLAELYQLAMTALRYRRASQYTKERSKRIITRRRTKPQHTKGLRP